MRANPPISHYLGRGNNSYSVLRLLAASAVVVTHAWTTVGGDLVPEPLQVSTGFSLGWHAVNLFFALSGLFIAGSLETGKSLYKFAWARLLRIFPALLVVIAVTIIVAAVVTDTSSWQSSHVVEYLIRNLFLVGSTATLPGVFSDTPSPDVINVPLWTLKYEVLAYFSIAGLAALSWHYSRLLPMRYVSLVVLAICAIALVPVTEVMSGYGRMEHALRLFFSFYLGVTFWYWRDRIAVNFSTMLVIASVYSLFLWFDLYYAPIQALAVAYLAFWIGTFDFGAVARFADRQDYSYGVYIIGFPIQQSVMAVTEIADPWFNFLVTLVIVIPLAALSWNLVEKPALRLKSLGNIDAFNRVQKFLDHNRHLFRPTTVRQRASR